MILYTVIVLEFEVKLSYSNVMYGDDWAIVTVQWNNVYFLSFYGDSSPVVTIQKGM